MSRFKSILVASLAIGLAISTALLAMDQLTDYAVLDWEMPGITAAYVFWGAVSSSVLLGTVIAWMVNSIVYAVPSFVVLGALEALRTIATR